MPPRRAVTKAKGVTTRQRKAIAENIEVEQASNKRLREVEDSSGDTDIEIALEDTVPRAEQEVGTKLAHLICCS